MNPQAQFCPNMECPARGKVEEGHITIHSQKERRYKCEVCGKTFSETKGTALYGIKKSVEQFVLVITLLAYGCPVKAIVMAFGLDERTVSNWQKKAGQHCQQVHEHIMEGNSLDLGQVQADEIRVKTQGGTMWMALAMMVSTRLWLGGAVSPKRDKHLIRKLAGQVRQWALCRPILVAVDGLSAYLKAFRDAFRTPVKDTKGPGRPRLWPWPDVAIVQVIKRRTQDAFSIERRIAQGDPDLIDRLLQSSQNGGVINTAFIERLNATFRQRLASLVRRSRALARVPATLEWGMYLVGCVYNFCTHHKSLRLPLWITERRIHWVNRTPATAARLTDHRWTIHELLTFKRPPPPFVPPKQRGRPPKLLFAEAVS
jgi:transposase-like protein